MHAVLRLGVGHEHSAKQHIPVLSIPIDLHLLVRSGQLDLRFDNGLCAVQQCTVKQTTEAQK